MWSHTQIPHSDHSPFSITRTYLLFQGCLYGEISSETGSLEHYFWVENMFLRAKDQMSDVFFFPAQASFLQNTSGRGNFVKFAVFGANRRCIIPAPSIHLSRRFVAMSCAVNGFEPPCWGPSGCCESLVMGHDGTCTSLYIDNH